MLISPAIINAKSTSIAFIGFVVMMLRLERMAVINITVFLSVMSSSILDHLYNFCCRGGRERERNFLFQWQPVKCDYFRRGMYEKKYT